MPLVNIVTRGGFFLRNCRDSRIKFRCCGFTELAESKEYDVVFYLSSTSCSKRRRNDQIKYCSARLDFGKSGREGDRNYMEDLESRNELIEFEEKVRRHRQYIFSLAYRLTGHREEAEDLTQETFLNAWKARKQLRIQEAILSWLRKICLNVFLQKERQRSGTKEITYLELSRY